MSRSKSVPLDGKRFGRLFVIKRVGTLGHNTAYKCVCDCGKESIVRGCDLLSGNTRSCGCLHGERHGHADDRLYSVWRTMKARCNNPNNQKYSDYGGRGIKVCDEWMHSFTSFYDWAMVNGYDYDAPVGQCTLDRIDVNGDYEPSNCRWVDAKTQTNNQRPRRQKIHGIEVDYKGVHYISLSQLAREHGFHSSKLERRVHRMSIDDAMSQILGSTGR